MPGVTAHSELELTEDLATLSSMAMWFLFGATVSYLAEIGLPGWEVFVFVAAALTVLRIVPIRLFLLGSDLPTEIDVRSPFSAHAERHRSSSVSWPGAASPTSTTHLWCCM